jgi:hypothetical protein
MSEENKEPANKLTDKTWVPLGRAVIIGASMLSGLWMLSGAVHDLKGTVDDLRRDRWTATDMERWSVLLERANRGQTPALVVPDVRDVQAVTRRLEK